MSLDNERSEELRDEELDSVAGGAMEPMHPHEEVPPHLQDNPEQEDQHPDHGPVHHDQPPT